LECEADRNSRFYRQFPSEEWAVEFHSSRRGYFDDLDTYCTVGYDATTSATLDRLVDTDNGIFVWDKHVQLRLPGGRKRDEPTLKGKRLQLIDYLLELCYELALTPSLNASTNPGFEAYLLGY
jgi:hypothetical protein